MNLEEIAKLSRVSRSTVSRVINNDPNVKEQTRAQVLEVVRRLNFHPNAAARSKSRLAKRLARDSAA